MRRYLADFRLKQFAVGEPECVLFACGTRIFLDFFKCPGVDRLSICLRESPAGLQVRWEVDPIPDISNDHTEKIQCQLFIERTSFGHSPGIEPAKRIVYEFSYIRLNPRH